MLRRATYSLFRIPPIAGLAAVLLLVPSPASIAGGAEEYAIYKSVDRGRAWFRSDTGLPRGSRINAFGSLNDLVFVGTDSGIFISGDEGKTWGPASGAAASSGRVISIAAFKSRVFAGTDGNGMTVSLDKGKRWSLDASFPSRKVRCLLAHDGSLFAGTDDQGVFASEDGKVWARLAQDFPTGGQVFALAAVKDTLFAGLYSNGLYAWNRRKTRWTRAGAVSPLALAAVVDGLVAGHNPGGIHWSGDLGSTWSMGRANLSGEFQPVLREDGDELPADAPVWELASDGELVLAGAAAGIYYSEDQGRTWTRARAGLPERSPGIAFFIKRGFVLAGTREQRTTQPKPRPGQ